MQPHITHLMGWTVVRATPSAQSDGFSEDVRSELRDGAQVAIELGTDPVGDLAVHDTLVHLQADALVAGARVVVVVTSGLERDRLKRSNRQLFRALTTTSLESRMRMILWAS